MTTLMNEEVYEYLNHLENETTQRISTSKEGTLQYLTHSTLKEIVQAERNFLEYVHQFGTEPSLSIRGSGMPLVNPLESSPSIHSLKPDLEKMCELTEEVPSLKNISQKFKKGFEGKNQGENSNLYVPVSEEEYDKQLTNRKEEKLNSQIGFAINEKDDGKFELALREDTFVNGYDEHSKNFPVLIREGKMTYNIVFNKLAGDCEESFYVPNTAMVVSGGNLSEKVFEDGRIFYPFKNSDFKGIRKPLLMRWRSRRVNYKELIAAGTDARVQRTKRILYALDDLFKTRLVMINETNSLCGFESVDGRKTREEILSFSKFAFENTKNVIPDFFEPHKVLFDLTFQDKKKIGTINYVLPHTRCVGYYDKFIPGGIILRIFGSILNQSQFDYLHLRPSNESLEEYFQGD